MAFEREDILKRPLENLVFGADERLQRESNEYNKSTIPAE
jgi:hypothetical protein